MFLHKHGVRFASIKLVGRGTTREQALRTPAVVVECEQVGTGNVGVGVDDVDVELVRCLFRADPALVAMVPPQVHVVEFVGLVPPDSRWGCAAASSLADSGAWEELG